MKCTHLPSDHTLRVQCPHVGRTPGTRHNLISTLCNPRPPRVDKRRRRAHGHLSRHQPCTYQVIQGDMAPSSAPCSSYPRTRHHDTPSPAPGHTYTPPPGPRPGARLPRAGGGGGGAVPGQHGAGPQGQHLAAGEYHDIWQYLHYLDTCPQLDVCTTWRDTRRCDHGDLCCLAHPPPGIEILER